MGIRVDFALPDHLPGLLAEMDAFIEAEIKPLEAENIMIAGRAHQLAAYLDDLSVPTLLLSMVHMTGDPSILNDPTLPCSPGNSTSIFATSAGFRRRQRTRKPRRRLTTRSGTPAAA